VQARWGANALMPSCCCLLLFCTFKPPPPPTHFLKHFWLYFLGYFLHSLFRQFKSSDKCNAQYFVAEKLNICHKNIKTTHVGIELVIQSTKVVLLWVHFYWEIVFLTIGTFFFYEKMSKCKDKV